MLTFRGESCKCDQKKGKLPQKLHVDLKMCRVASAAVESQQGRLFVMRVACCRR